MITADKQQGGSVMASWDQETLDAALREHEVELTTWGRKSGTPSRVIIWIRSDGQRIYIRSGGGMGRDWPQNLRARGQAILHMAGRDIPVRARFVTDLAEARTVHAMGTDKYPNTQPPPAGDDPPTPGELATFELTPDDPAT
jgi:deazaflavin-dependent oxidoreductase (nitroreductase family)